MNFNEKYVNIILSMIFVLLCLRVQLLLYILALYMRNLMY